MVVPSVAVAFLRSNCGCDRVGAGLTRASDKEAGGDGTATASLLRSEP